MCSNTTLNQSIKALTLSVDSLRHATTNLRVEMAEYKTMSAEHTRRIEGLEERERTNKSSLDTLGGKAALALGLVVVAANILGPLLVGVIAGHLGG